MKTVKLFSIACMVMACLALGKAVAASPYPVAFQNLQEVDSTGSPASVAAAWPVYLNEVLPLPGSGEHQWVELFRPRTSYLVYLPLVVRGAGSLTFCLTPPVSSQGSTSTDPDISGWQLINKAGKSYTFPEALLPLPENAFVLVYFDGLGPAADDYDFSDGVAVLHTPAGLVNTFDPTADQVALYAGAIHNAQTVRDFVAYGGPPGDAATDAISANLWEAAWWVELQIGSGAVAEGKAPALDRSFGLYPGQANLSPEDWAVYTAADLTPGAANPIPRSTWSAGDDGEVMASDGFALGWAFVPGATYQLQIDDDLEFGSPLINELLAQPYYQPQTPPPDGHYWWRVRAVAGETRFAAWSAPLQVTVVPLAGEAADSDTRGALITSPEVELPMTWLRQRKDTRLLCLDGDGEGDPVTSDSEEAWDAVHPDDIYTHGRNNSVRASIAMIVTKYGGHLSQDRLAYQLFENWGSPIENIGELDNPLLDLGHDRTTLSCGADGSNAGRLLAWALGIKVREITYANGTPAFGDVKGWIDASRPIMRFHNGHMTVISGYRVNGGAQEIRLLDPYRGTTWPRYSKVKTECYYVPPAAAPGVRSDESSIWSDANGNHVIDADEWSDADGDGILDWDEQNRFHTQTAAPDSDGDAVHDKQDLREYVFNAAGDYRQRNDPMRDPDYDRDGLRKELDADNDNGGSLDGCEDTDHNGKQDPGETSNFDPTDDRPCAVTVSGKW